MWRIGAAALAVAAAAGVVAAQMGWHRAGGLGRGAGTLRVTANSVEYVDGKRVWVAGKDGFLASSVDNGATWTEVKTPVTAELNDIYFRSGDDGWAVGADGWVLSTDDGGRSWRSFQLESFREGPERGRKFDLYSIRFGDKKNGWVVGDEGTIFATSDAGRTWI